MGHRASLEINSRDLLDTDRFWEKVNKTDTCWMWIAGKGRGGYGKYSVLIGWKKRTLGAHRYSYALAYGICPAGLIVCHRCDTPACVRPDHLFLGTDSDNMKDMHAKGRGPRGVKHSHAKLTDDQVREIRKMTGTGAEIGAKFGVTKGTIQAILVGRTWVHVK